MCIYQKHMSPDWRTLEMLDMNMLCTTAFAQNTPSVLSTTRFNANELLIDYVLARRMSGLAVSIVRGLAAYFDEADRIYVISPMS
jgi:hypothetical protein